MKRAVEEAPSEIQPAAEIRGPGRKLLSNAVFIILILAAAVVGALSGLLLVYSTDLPQVTELETYRPSTITQLYDDQDPGEHYPARIHRREFGYITYCQQRRQQQQPARYHARHQTCPVRCGCTGDPVRWAQHKRRENRNQDTQINIITSKINVVDARNEKQASHSDGGG